MKTGLAKTLILSALLGIGAVSLGVTAKTAVEVSAAKPGSDVPSRDPNDVEYTMVRSKEDLLSSSIFILGNQKNGRVATGGDTSNTYFSSTAATFSKVNDSYIVYTQTNFTFKIKFVDEPNNIFSLVANDGSYVSVSSSGISLITTQTDATKLTITFEKSGNEYNANIMSGSYGIFFDKQNSTFKAGSSGNKFEVPQLYTTQGEQETTDFVSEFKNGLTCDQTGENGPSFTGDTSWGSLKAAFNSLSFVQQNRLSTATYLVTGSGTATIVTPTYPSDLTQDEAQVLYDYDTIVSKYGWENFMDRPGTVNARINGLVATNGTQTATIVISTLVGFTAIGAFVSLKKRKHN